MVTRDARYTAGEDPARAKEKNMNRKWAAVGAASVLGFGLIAGGAVAAANASEIKDAPGDPVGEKISVEQPLDGTKTFVDSANSVPSPKSVKSPQSPQSPQSVTEPATVEPASPISVDSPASINSPQSPNSPNSPDSPASLPSVDSVDSAD